MLKPVEKQRVAEEIVEQLRSLILTGQYKVGDKLPPERELAKKLGVNRASLREALKKLEHLGLVRIRQGDGTRVTNFMETAGIELVRHLVPQAGAGAIDAELTKDVLEFRRVIGREMARLATDRATDSDRAQLVRIADEARSTELSAADLFRLDFEFYVALTAATQNRVMVLLINTVRDAVAQYGPLLAHLTVTRDQVIEHHRAILKAIEAGDATAAADIADRYLARGAEHLRALIEGGAIAVTEPATD